MSELTKDAVLRTVHTFVLRAGRMTDAQRKAYETLSQRWCVPYTGSPLNFIDIFDNKPATIVETIIANKTLICFRHKTQSKIIDINAGFVNNSILTNFFLLE